MKLTSKQIKKLNYNEWNIDGWMRPKEFQILGHICKTILIKDQCSFSNIVRGKKTENLRQMISYWLLAMN